jgi:N-acetylglucosaminyl-diphospho-decaprenol L-rhamnosyltransferase
VSELAVVIVSYNTRPHLSRCLDAVAGRGWDVLVVDNASDDASAALARDAGVRVLQLPANVGFGAAANRGFEATDGRYVLLLNPDAAPRDEQAIPRLLACADADPGAAVLGPALVGSDGGPQPSLVGVPTRWWTGAPAISTVPPGWLGRLGPRLRASDEHFLVGAALLLRRSALAELAGFDSDFFLFGEDVDLCLRAQRAGWAVRLCSDAVFVHAGGAATHRDWPALYREQLRGHLRLLAKHEGHERAERARRYLRIVLRARSLYAGRDDRMVFRDAASWLASADVRTLLAQDRMSPDRTPGAAGRTSDSAD